MAFLSSVHRIGPWRVMGAYTWERKEYSGLSTSLSMRHLLSSDTWQHDLIAGQRAPSKEAVYENFAISNLLLNYY
jgi:hypothetical protein